MWREVPWVKELPSEYVRRHFRLTTAPAHLPPDVADVDRLLEMLGGVGMLVYSSDSPHRHDDGLAALLDRVGADERRAVLGAYAVAHYGLAASAPAT